MINGEWWLDVLLRGILIPSLAPDTEYTISVHAFDIYKQLSEPATLVYVPKDITPPSPPGNLRQSTPIAESVTLTWARSTDDIGIHEYIIYNDNEHFDSTSANTYTANDLPPGRYSFDVCTIDLSGNASEPATIVVNIKDPLSDGPKNFRFERGLIPKLEWDAPDIEPVIRYEIVLTGPQGNTLPYNTSSTFLKPLLLPLTHYKVSIRALMDTGLSQPLIDEFTT